MITIPEVVEELVKQSPFLEEALSQGLINNSSLARRLKSQIDKKLFKDVQPGAIIMALSRLEQKLANKQFKHHIVLGQIKNITVRSDIIEFTFLNSPALTDKQREFMHSIENDKAAFITFAQGVYETTLFISSNLEQKVNNIFKDETLKAKFENLSSITLILPEEAVNTPGIYYQILKVLAWEGINFVDIISSFTELSIFLEEDKVDKAFSALKNISA